MIFRLSQIEQNMLKYCVRKTDDIVSYVKMRKQDRHFFYYYIFVYKVTRFEI